MVHRLSWLALVFAFFLFACGRPNSETAELGSTRQAASQPTAVNPTEAPTWPTEAQWIPLMKGSTALYDIVKDKSGDSDVVGDATHASIYVYSDGTHLFWRLRINATPGTVPNLDNGAIWVCLINTDTDYGTYEWLTWVNGKGSTDTTEIWRNTSTASNYYDSPSDSPDVFISALNATSDSLSHVRVVNTATTSSPSNFPTNSADADYFVDAAFDISSFAGTINSTTPLRLACGTSATSQGLNADFTSPSASVTSLSALYSDSMTCGVNGCPVCNSSSACGSTCTTCSGTTPVCSAAGACAACDGDYGTGTANACSSAGSPYCAANGSCTTCANSSDCTAGTATHGGLMCTSGACVSYCDFDSDCASNQWCSTATNKCVAKLSNGTAIPSEPSHLPALNGCTTAGASAVCTSGVCDSDGKCGYLERTQTCTQANAATVCRSGICGAGSNVCISAGACAADGDCGSTEYCDGNTNLCTAKLANDVSTVSDPLHPSGGACPAIECSSGVCDADGKCGYANGGGTCDATNGSIVCRSGSCSGTKCGCTADTDCASTEFCRASTATCTAKLTTGTPAISDSIHSAGCPEIGAAECESGYCGASSFVCLAAGTCAADLDCLSTQYCNGTICVAKLANDVATTADVLHTGGCPAVGPAECQSGACDTDGKCGYALGSGTCTPTDATACRSGVCGSGGKCGCAADSECGSGEFCNGTACVTKLANGAATSADPIHTSSCPTLGAAECQSGTCDSDGACGLANGSSCSVATESICRSGYCGPGSNVCLAAGACAADSDCSGATYCDGSACVPKKANNVATTTDPLHAGTCPALAVECTSGVCDARDGKCGYALAGGTCDNTNGLVVCRTGVCATSGTCGCSADADCAATEYCNASTNACATKLDLGSACDSANASRVCQSGTCGSASLACIPAGGNGCWTDGDCLGTQFCTSAHTCTAKLANGVGIPQDTAHDGVCNGTNATAVCASGACDPSDNTCGIGLEHGTCASTEQCTAGVCVLGGTNAGRCEPCLNDTSCSGTTPACNPETNHCVTCTASTHDLCTGDTPLCNLVTNACMGCSADRGELSAAACASSSAPFCTPTGACGACTTNAQCTGHAGGAFCDLTTGACGAGCTIDGDCAASEWCSNPTAQPVSGTCVPKLANGDLVPSSLLTDGTCTTALGARVCTTGVCDDADQRCGYPNRTACGSASVCRSGVCNADGRCGDPNGFDCTTAATCRSNQCEFDGKCGLVNLSPCLDDVACRTGACVAGHCGLPNGDACDRNKPEACRATLCFADGACGLPNGQACQDGNRCRSGSCYQGRCEALCDLDEQCASGLFCTKEVRHCDPKLPNGLTCARDAMCLSGVCNADGKCGDPDGFACAAPSTCRHDSCVEGKCRAALGPGEPCTLDESCQSRICALDGRCGVPRNGACSAPSQCRDGACDATGTCVAACANDHECVALAWCNDGACARDRVNGTPCTRDAQCESDRCGADGLCGAKNGESCASASECRSGACDPSTLRCGYENGNGPCTTANASAVCLSGACAADGKCGLPNNGPTCSSDEQCRGAACDGTAKTCVLCKSDGACAANEACNAGNCVLKLANGLGCTRKAECIADVCGSDGRCGKADGETCATASVCRTGVCSSGQCGVAKTTNPPTDAGAPDASSPVVTADAGAPAPAPLSAPTPVDAGAPATSHAMDGDVLQGGGGLSCASAPGSTATSGLGLLAIAGLALLRRRRR